MSRWQSRTPGASQTDFDDKFAALRDEQRAAHSEETRRERDEQIKARLAALVESSAQVRRTLSGHLGFVPQRVPFLDLDAGGGAHLLFSGSLRPEESVHGAIVPMASQFMGGFVVRTAHGNFLFDAVDGTLNGMAQLGIAVPDIDVIVTSEGSYARELGKVLAVLQAHGRGLTSPLRYALSKRAMFTAASTDGESGAILPSRERLGVESISVTPGHAWRIQNSATGVIVNKFTGGLTRPEGKDALLLRALPALHRKPSTGFLLEEAEYRILYTGNTGYPGNLWTPDLWAYLGEREITVLIANVGTIAGDVRHPEALCGNGHPTVPRVSLTDLPRMRDCLGLDGTLRLAAAIKPKVLVIQSLGLDCVVDQRRDGSLRYRPQNLALIHEHLTRLLARHAPDTKVIVPGRHELLIDPQTGSRVVAVKDYAVVPAFTSGDMAVFGEPPHVFRTVNPRLANAIRATIAMLLHHPRPFVLIEGVSGGGKTLLARAIASEITKHISGKSCQPADPAETIASAPHQTPVPNATGDNTRVLQSKRKPRRTDEPWESWIVRKTAQLPFVQEFDLATVDTHSNVYGNLLWGWTPGMFHAEDRGHPGRLAKKDGVLILNQFEKVPLEFSKSLTDLLSNWQYEPLGATHHWPAQVRIIFTSNVEFECMNNLASDLKNRIRGRRLRIPALDELTPEVRRAEIDLFVSGWCEAHGVVLSSDTHEALKRIDLGNGAFRCLQELLDHAKRIVLADYGLYSPIEAQSSGPDGAPGQQFIAGDRQRTSVLPVFITRGELERAMKRDGLSYISAAGDGTNKIPEILALKIAIWLSFQCQNKRTYSSLRAGHGKAPEQFVRMLAAFRRCFETAVAAWNYFTNPEALRNLFEATDMDAWLATLQLAPDPVEQAMLFIVPDYHTWAAERLRILQKLLLADDSARDRLKRSFCARLDAAAGKFPKRR